MVSVGWNICSCDSFKSCKLPPSGLRVRLFSRTSQGVSIWGNSWWGESRLHCERCIFETWYFLICWKWGIVPFYKKISCSFYILQQKPISSMQNKACRLEKKYMVLERSTRRNTLQLTRDEMTELLLSSALKTLCLFKALFCPWPGASYHNWLQDVYFYEDIFFILLLYIPTCLKHVAAIKFNVTQFRHVIRFLSSTGLRCINRCFVFSINIFHRAGFLTLTVRMDSAHKPQVFYSNTRLHFSILK